MYLERNLPVTFKRCAVIGVLVSDILHQRGNSSGSGTVIQINLQHTGFIGEQGRSDGSAGVIDVHPVGKSDLARGISLVIDAQFIFCCVAAGNLNLQIAGVKSVIVHVADFSIRIQYHRLAVFHIARGHTLNIRYDRRIVLHLHLNRDIIRSSSILTVCQRKADGTVACGGIKRLHIVIRHLIDHR